MRGRVVGGSQVESAPLMAGKDVPIHYLRANHREWTPKSIIYLDTETRSEARGRDELLTLRLWCARHVQRPGKRRTRPAQGDQGGHTRAELADWVEMACAGRGTTWLFCHNLSFDLTTTRLPNELARRGWEVTDSAIGGKSPWLRMSHGSTRLCMVDSTSWFPTSLADLGELIGLPKPALPAERDSEQAWLARCWADVDILAAAMGSMLDWWDSGELGNWTLSGAGCGWNSYRHMPSPYKVLIDPDDEKVKHDRKAVYGGRRGVWRVGEQNAGPFLELDLVAAYPTVAAHIALPMRRRHTFTALAVDDPLVTSERWGVIADVEINTPVARFPVKLGGATWYPVGTFTTRLAGPDIREARRLGCLVSIGAGAVHQLGHHMASWARWVLETQSGNTPDAPPAAQVAAKHWGRAVIGKWAAHGYEKTEWGPSPFDSWSYQEGFDHATQTRGGVLDLAGRRWWVHSGGVPENAYPAVWAFVEAEIRVRLSRIIEAIGPAAVIQCDTDGLIVAARLIGTRASGGHLIAPTGSSSRARINWVLDNIEPVVSPLSLRLKRSSRSVHIHGPQHLRLDSQRRLSGMPRSATEIEPNVFRAHTWPGLTWQMKNGAPDGYIRPEVTRHMRATYPTGWVTIENRVLPPQTRICTAGTTVLVPWAQTRWAADGHTLTDVQHPYLDQYR